MYALKTNLRQSFIAPLYFWGANRYRMLRRLFIGRVCRVSQAEGQPLLYHRGAYRLLGPVA